MAYLIIVFCVQFLCGLCHLLYAQIHLPSKQILDGMLKSLTLRLQPACRVCKKRHQMNKSTTPYNNNFFHEFISSAPGIPRNLTAKATSFENLFISWKPPAVSNGIIRNYSLSLCLMVDVDGNGENVGDCGNLSSILLPANISSFNASDGFELCKYSKNVIKLQHCLFFYFDANKRTINL